MASACGRQGADTICALAQCNRHTCRCMHAILPHQGSQGALWGACGKPNPGLIHVLFCHGALATRGH